MNLLARLRRHDAMRAFDLALADTLQRLDPGSDERVLAAAALAAASVGHGHAGFDPAQPQWLLGEPGGWPAAADWIEALRGSRWVAVPEHDMVSDPHAPLVLEHGLLYLRRYREYERRLAAGLRRIATAPVPPVAAGALAPLFARLFPEAGSGDDDQARAAALALCRQLLLVTGGPGTGKTTTVARLLLLLLAQAHDAGRPSPRIALAAPTGRAAERLADSLRRAVAGVRALPGIADSHGLMAVAVADAAALALPQDAQTLHRLLGSRPDGSPRFRFGAGNPLPYEVVVVDEASMVDLPLMCKLVEAVPDGARLVLLGDPDQLPSVEAGDVLAAITEAAGVQARLPPALAAGFGFPDEAARGVPASQHRDSPGAVDDGALAGCRVQLGRGYRQSPSLQLAPLAEAVRDGDAAQALALLRDGALPGVHFHDGLGDLLTGDPRQALLDHWRALADETDPARALQHADGLRVLTALRDGPQGASTLNARIEELLAGPQHAPYFQGRLLLVTRNSYRHRLYNGDIGICLRDDAGAMAAWFADGGNGVRAFHPAALPAHSGAFAMTVHKAQGSEFDDVWLLLPKQDARALSRELLYTALTRARRSLHVCASEAALCAALQRHVVRVSRLAQRLNTRHSTTSA